MQTTSAVSPTKEEGESVEKFVVFGLVMIISITAFVAGIVFIIQKLKAVKKLCCKINGSDRNEQGSNNFCLQPLRLHSKTTGKTTDEVIKTSFLKRENSLLSEKSEANGCTRKTTSPREFPHVVSIELLRDDCEMACIMLLPIPYDHYTRDVSDLLRTVFTIEGDIPTQCVFDDFLCMQYSKNKNTWFDSVFSDNKRILMFLCFTSLKGRPQEKTIAEEMLKHFEVDKVQPRCHCIVLDVTDNMKELDDHYHGLSLRVKHDNAYERLISHVLELTGKNLEHDRTALDKMLHCEASENFLSVIGHD